MHGSNCSFSVIAVQYKPNHCGEATTGNLQSADGLLGCSGSHKNGPPFRQNHVKRAGMQHRKLPHLGVAMP